MNIMGLKENPVLALYFKLTCRQKVSIGLYLLMLLLVVGLQLPIPFLISDIIDSLSRAEEGSMLHLKILGVVGLGGVSLWLSTLSEIYSAVINRQFNLNLRLTVFDSLQRAPYRFNRKYNVSDLLARFTGDVNTLNHLLPTGFANIVRYCFFVLAFSGVLVYISPTIVLYIFGFLPLAVVIFLVMRGKLSRFSIEARDGYAEANGTIQESLISLREGRVIGSRDFHFQRLRDSLEQSETKILQARRYSALMMGVLGVIPIMVTAMIWLIGSNKIDAEEMTVGQLISVMIVLSMLYSPISGLFEAASGYVYEKAAFKRIANIANEAFEINKETDLIEPGVSDNIILKEENAPFVLKLQDITFAYHSIPVFKGFNAIIPAGKCTALVGPNGVGKSTLIALMTGLEHPSSGGVYLDYISLCSLNTEARAHHYGYIPQDVFIFGDTLRSNITVGRNIPDEQIFAMLDELGWKGFMGDWGEGLNTQILENGRNLSGGQKQKVAVLRALVNRPSILILDEPDNNLEECSLNQFVGYLKKIKGRCTVVLVTHGNAFQSVIDSTLELAPELSHEYSS